MGRDNRYDVGYGKPPVHSRFKPGQSGNPRGRRRGAKSLAAILQAALTKRVWVTENGQRRSISKLEAMTTQLVNRATSADLPAAKLLLALIDMVEKQKGAAPTSQVELTQDDESVMKELLERMQTMESEEKS